MRIAAPFLNLTLNEMTNEIIARARRTPISIGELIKQLDRLPQNLYVYFDFGNFMPNIDAERLSTKGMDSYRGRYEDICIGYRLFDYDLVAKDTNLGHVTAGRLLTNLRYAAKCTFNGYKGGEYQASDDSILWAANYGESTGTGITGAILTDSTVILTTAYCNATTNNC